MQKTFFSTNPPTHPNEDYITNEGKNWKKNTNLHGLRWQLLCCWSYIDFNHFTDLKCTKWRKCDYNCFIMGDESLVICQPVLRLSVCVCLALEKDDFRANGRSHDRRRRRRKLVLEAHGGNFRCGILGFCHRISSISVSELHQFPAVHFLLFTAL